ncbi:TIGR01457 family HAD-type hydrolase [Halalkalibacter sp. APA_J-10(15)]|uniref:TIGR01457 family HAD-type hydrolase n=1 Tax=Halalkalibacter sp. APA_J-10(15) TaxID=2933805 RepID=UPI001FF68225|nr:TIGR01457 family HAD-type hydrolase [Halalkalibacter sp. APA_J-10(15)]MCK0472729.1 TIGR01457 family HAD-type hydrolase [Halalkalibacter sp. APA_J-10(15)]
MTKAYKGYLIDLDGTMYRGSEKIPEAIEFVKELKQQEIPYLFVTNNSTKPPADVAKHLREMDVPAEEEHVFTTSMATATYISQIKNNAKVCMVGEEGLKLALLEEGHELVEEGAEIVVMGLDRQITYEKLAKAALNIRAGATFIATNGDVALPTERGLVPGAGSLISVLSVSTGVTPTFIGKPEAVIVEQALDVMGLTHKETIMVGDNYHTDILAGIRTQMDTLLVYTGVSTKEHVATYDERPTFEIHSLSEWGIVKS